MRSPTSHMAFDGHAANPKHPLLGPVTERLSPLVSPINGVRGKIAALVGGAPARSPNPRSPPSPSPPCVCAVGWRSFQSTVRPYLTHPISLATLFLPDGPRLLLPDGPIWAGSN